MFWPFGLPATRYPWPRSANVQPSMLDRNVDMKPPLSRTSRSVSALLFESPLVIGARLGQFAQPPSPSYGVMNEMMRMVIEKQIALGESMMTMWAHTLKWQSQWFVGMLGAMAQGRMPTMLPSARVLDRAASDALAPYLKRVRSNRRRLSHNGISRNTFDLFY